jgi:hypothetical protein
MILTVPHSYVLKRMDEKNWQKWVKRRMYIEEIYETWAVS